MLLSSPSTRARDLEETDLIYEGIATGLPGCSFRDPTQKEETDLIYEGIATWN